MKKPTIYEATPGNIKRKADYIFVEFKDRNRLAVVKDSKGNFEEYGISPNFAGWKLIIDGKDYEFLHSLSPEYAKSMIGKSKTKNRVTARKSSSTKDVGRCSSKSIGKVKDSNELIDEIIERGIITEAELNLLKNRKTRGEIMNDDLFFEAEISLTKDQTDKGLKWLMNQWKSPSGQERKNNPFGAREKEILDNFKEFYFFGFYDAGNSHHSFYVPIYTVCGGGMCFDYVTSSKGIEIIG